MLGGVMHFNNNLMPRKGKKKLNSGNTSERAQVSVSLRIVVVVFRENKLNFVAWTAGFVTYKN